MGMKIKLGPAGSPGNSTLEGIKMVKDLGLQAMEVEFVKGIYMDNSLAEKCGKLAKELRISLSVHAPYYINLASPSQKVREASFQRILISCERAERLGATCVVFHPGYYGFSRNQTYQMVKKGVVRIMETLKEREWNVKLSPETSGKLSQFGSFQEILSLSQETGCSFCLDFAHIYARNFGKIDYKGIFDEIEKIGVKELHSHFSNISYGLKGERKHLPMDSSPEFEPLAKEILERKIPITIISESPITWKDSLRMKEIFRNLGCRF